MAVNPSISSKHAELIRCSEVARRLDCSPSTVDRMDQSGRMPQSIRLGGMRRWRATEISQWVADGCPRIRPGSRRWRSAS